MTKICSKVASKSETIMRERLAYEYYTSNVRVYIYIYMKTRLLEQRLTEVTPTIMTVTSESGCAN